MGVSVSDICHFCATDIKCCPQCIINKEDEVQSISKLPYYKCVGEYLHQRDKILYPVLEKLYPILIGKLGQR